MKTRTLVLLATTLCAPLLVQAEDEATIHWAAAVGPQNTVQTISPALSPAGDAVYFASGLECKLYAFNTANGNPITNFPFSYTGTANASNAGRSGSPVVAADGTIYFPATGDEFSDSRARLFAVNPNGTQKWVYIIDGTDKTTSSYIAPAITKDGDILTGNGGTPGALHLVNKTDGTAKIAKVTPAGGILGAIVVSQNNIAYGLAGNYGLAAYSFDNSAFTSKGTYKVQNENSHYTSGSPAIDGSGNVIAAFNQLGGDDAAIVALNASSANISPTSAVWEYLFAPTPASTKKMEQFGASVGTNGTIYVAGHETQKIYAMNPNGSVKWTYSTGEDIASTPAIDNRGFLHFGGWNGNYYILKDNGISAELIYMDKLTFDGATSSQIWSSPAIANDGTIYVSAQVKLTDESVSSRLFKITVDGTTGPANSWWPMRGGNAQRTGLQKEKLTPTGLVSTDSPKQLVVCSQSGGIRIEVSEPLKVSVYNMAGQCNFASSQAITGSANISLPAGIYIVKAGNNVVKVAVR